MAGRRGNREGSIYNEMLSYRKWATNLFTGSEDRLRALRLAVDSAGSR